MKEFWTSFANALTGENGPLYFAMLAITGLTLGWRFLDKNYQAEWDCGKICPAGSSPMDSETAPKDNPNTSPEVEDTSEVSTG